MSETSGRDDDRPPRDRFELDIEDALRRAGADQLPTAPRPRLRPPGASLPDWRPRSPGQVVLVGGLLLLLAYLRVVGPLTAICFQVGLFLLAFGLVTWLLRPRNSETYWRGQRIDLGQTASWRARLYRAVYRGR